MIQAFSWRAFRGDSWKILPSIFDHKDEVCEAFIFLKIQWLRMSQSKTVQSFLLFASHLFQQITRNPSSFPNSPRPSKSRSRGTIHPSSQAAWNIHFPQVWRESWNTILVAMVGFGIPALTDLMVVWREGNWRKLEGPQKSLPIFLLRKDLNNGI